MRRILPVAIGLAMVAAFAARSSAQTLPPGFVAEEIAPGAGFVVPVQVVWLPDGRMLVVEKRGRIQVVKNGIKNATPMWQGDNEVLDQQDRGFLSVAVDPHYFVNHYIYLLYSVDPDSDGVDTNAYGFGRLTRYQVNFTDSNTVIKSSRTILMGTKWADAPEVLSPSHAIGTVRFAKDGSLLVTAGDGANFTFADAGGASPSAFGPGLIDPYEDIGSFRAQDVNTINGKVLRLNPANGHGYASNPFADGNLADKRSKVWDYGLRNPYRFNLRPGTGSTDTSAANPGVIYLGDVGQDTWEEADIARTGGINFGWPCYEGAFQSPPFQSASPAHTDCSSYGTSANPNNPTLPNLSWNHTDGTYSNPPGLTGNCSIGGVFYEGSFYPAGYQDRYFFMDYGVGWIKYATVDANDNVLSVQDFGDGLPGPVDLEVDPVTGDLIYISIYQNKVMRIRYTGVIGGNNPPQAHAQGSPNVGAPPLNVNFASTGTFDPDADPLTYTWNFGDGQGAVGPTASHTYNLAGAYQSVLTVDDGRGGIGRDTVHVTVLASAQFPTTPVLDDFNRADGPLGPNWGDSDGNLAIMSGQLGQNAQTWNDAIWEPTVFGPTQECFFTMTQISPIATEHDLNLKVQGTTYLGGLIEVRFDPSTNHVYLNTYDPANNWRGWLTLSNIVMQPGDQFGARAYPGGTIDIYQNGTRIGEGDVSQWPFNSGGGRLGLEMTYASASRLDNFGGGDAILNFNTPPIGFITSPVNHSFYATGDTVHLRGYAHDAQDSASALTYRWEVDLHHNNHIHPSSYTSDSAAFDFVAQNHDDGTGVWLNIRYLVTDTGGLCDTTYSAIYPEVDLTPNSLHTDPDTIGTTSPAAYEFKIDNLGRMPSHIFHWMLMADGFPIAQGDTLVPALSGVWITRVLPPSLSAGTHLLRAIADTLGTPVDSLGQMVETDETNNTTLHYETVIPGGSGLAAPPQALVFSLSGATPNPSRGTVMFRLELPDRSDVGFDILDVQGRLMWRQDPQSLDPGIWPLRWNGRNATGGIANPGLYLARLRIGERMFVRRFVLLH